MECTISRVAIGRLYEALRSLGYHPMKTDGRTGEWRRSQYHLYTHPFGKKGVKLSLHKDIWNQSPPSFAHKAENQGKDIERELQLIQQRYGNLRRMQKVKG